MSAFRICLVLIAAGATLPAPVMGQLTNPTSCGDCVAGWFYYDHDDTDGVQDWQCETSTYDRHRGSDFSLRGGNAAIDGAHNVVAAAAGEVESAVDGFFDRCTSCGGTDCGVDFGAGYGNHIIVRHGDFRVVYAHLRMGSVRVGPGDVVGCGQVIANIGSSGCSTGAHLHFEVRPEGATGADAFDPFEGPCSAASRSSWITQGTHRGLPGAECPAECPPGQEGVWHCGSMDRTRCVAGETESEACPFGCTTVRDEGMCNGAPRCRDGLTDAWQCDGNDRVRCVGVSEEREMCIRCDGSAEVAICVDEADGDGDGVGVSADCDDTNPNAFPGAMEVCGDGVDQDCNGSDAPCVDGGVAPRRLLTGGCGVGASRSGSFAFVVLILLVVLRRRI